MNLAPPAAVLRQPASEIVAAASIGELTRIFEPDTQLCFLPRPRDPDLDAYLNHAWPLLGVGLRQLVRLDAVQPALDLPDLPGRQALLADMQLLLAWYGDLLGCPRVALRLEVVKQAMCPRFHVDRTGIRLLCAWRGPGTQWLSSGHADRRMLGHGAQGLDDAASGLILYATGIGQVPPHAVALIKGDAWQDNAGRGLIPRPPTVPPEIAPRVLLALDAVWDE